MLNNYMNTLMYIIKQFKIILIVGVFKVGKIIYWALENKYICPELKGQSASNVIHAKAFQN